MDEFAALRRRLYEEHGAFGAPGAGKATEALYAALSGGAARATAVLDEVRQARVLAEGAGGVDALSPLLERLGANPYLDRYLTDALHRCGPAQAMPALQRCLEEAAGRNPPDTDRLAACLQIAAELGLPAFPAERVVPGLVGVDPNLRAASAYYIAALGMGEAIEPLLASLTRGEPALTDAEQVEAAGAVVALALECGREPAEAAGEACRRLARPGLAAELLYTGLPRASSGLVLVQTMFYGDPARAGRGNSGGIATLLRDLGNELASGGALVLTLVPYNTTASPYPFRALELLAPGHAVLRLPLHLASDDALGFLRAHGRIRAGLRRLFRLAGVRPQVLHVRFLDDASLAAAREAEGLGATLVTTLTPDPHRSLCDASGRFRPLATEAALEALNKIAIGDELLRRSRGIVGIGRRAVREQLLPYFPQLEDPRGRLITGIDEGIRMQVPAAGLDVPALFADPSLELRLTEPGTGRPVMLNVGRLSPLKGQLNLLRAWLQGQWWRRYDLVLIGGEFRSPSPGEREIIGEIRGLAAAHPPSRGHLAHLEALPNAQVREIEVFFGSRTLVPSPDLYVCSSLKEEFGISIIEAMAAGMVVCAPLRGGTRRYLRHGVNGFLIDTADASSLTRELSGLLAGPPLSAERVLAIQHNARETVRLEFSIEHVAGQFAALYKSVLTVV